MPTLALLPSTTELLCDTNAFPPMAVAFVSPSALSAPAPM